jgi:hypothetical protein
VNRRADGEAALDAALARLELRFGRERLFAAMVRRLPPPTTGRPLEGSDEWKLPLMARLMLDSEAPMSVAAAAKLVAATIEGGQSAEAAQQRLARKFRRNRQLWEQMAEFMPVMSLLLAVEICTDDQCRHPWLRTLLYRVAARHAEMWPSLTTMTDHELRNFCGALMAILGQGWLRAQSVDQNVTGFNPT